MSLRPPEADHGAGSWALLHLQSHAQGTDGASAQRASAQPSNTGLVTFMQHPMALSTGMTWTVKVLQGCLMHALRCFQAALAGAPEQMPLQLGADRGAGTRAASQALHPSPPPSSTALVCCCHPGRQSPQAAHLEAA